MDINKVKEGNSLTLDVIGRLDTLTAPQLEKEIEAEIAGVKILTLNMAQLEYISSAGLRVVLSAHKKMMKQGQLIIKNLSEEVNEVFEITGFADIMDIQ